MFRLLFGSLTFVTVASSPMLAFAAGARSQTFEEAVHEKVVERLEAKDMRVRVIPVSDVCGKGEGYKVEVLIAVTKTENGQAVTKLVKVKTYGAQHRIWGGPKVIDCQF